MYSFVYQALKESVGPIWSSNETPQMSTGTLQRRAFSKGKEKVGYLRWEKKLFAILLCGLAGFGEVAGLKTSSA